MKRVAIVGGGIAGLAAAYELERQREAGRPLDWRLYEASERLGGIVQTTRRQGPGGEYILEGGPDAWVTEKPWARELAEELGLGDQIITSRDEEKKTYVWLDGQLVAMPDRLRMMVPEDLQALENSALFSAGARRAYADELRRVDELKASVPETDESVASFVRRHFGEEVLEKIGAPLLSGVFGGDTERLSVRAVMPAFVKMEAEHGSLIAALQERKRGRAGRPPQPTFTTLRRGMGSLVEAVNGSLPADRLYLQTAVTSLGRDSGEGWVVRTQNLQGNTGESRFDEVLVAVPVDGARKLLESVDADAAALIPQDASSAVLSCFCWPAGMAGMWDVLAGFGFLVSQGGIAVDEEGPRLLAGTFTDQKFPDRAPAGARVWRAFFGGAAAESLVQEGDSEIAEESLRGLRRIFPRLPDPDPALTTIARWPRSLPQYEVGHPQRIAELECRLRRMGGVHLLGNGYRGVGVPDLIRDGRSVARSVAQS